MALNSSSTLSGLILFIISLSFAHCNHPSLDPTPAPSTSMSAPTDNEGVLAHVFIFKLIPGDTTPALITIECNGTQILKKFPLKSRMAEILSVTSPQVYTATLVWKQFTATVPVYEPSRDAGQAYVYLKIAEDGIYFGYHQSSLKKMAPWKPKVI